MRILCVLITTIILSACDFHLRGLSPLPTSRLAGSSVAIVAEHHDRFAAFFATLRNALQQRGVVLQNIAANYDWELQFTMMHRSRRELALDDAGDASEYQLEFSLMLTIVNLNSGDLRYQQKLLQTERYSVDELTSDMEQEAIIHSSLNAAMAEQISEIVARLKKS